MNTSAGLESREEMLETAHADGFSPTDVQLKAWRRAGLIPRPVDQQGLGQARGSVTFYPAGAGAQLAALGRLRQRERNLGRLAFLLWWDGYPVSLDAVRRSVRQELDALAEIVDATVAGDELSDQGWTAIDRAETDPRVSAAAKSVRMRVGKHHLSTVSRALVLTASGAFPGWSENAEGERTDTDLMAVAIGIPLVNGLFTAAGVRTQIPSDAASALRSISANVNPKALRAALEQSTDDDLGMNRGELRAFFIVIDDLLYLSRKTSNLQAALKQAGRSGLVDPGGLLVLTMLATLVDQLVPDRHEFSTRDLMWLFLAGVSLSRGPKIRQGLSEIGRAGGQFHEVRVEAERYFTEQRERVVE